MISHEAKMRVSTRRPILVTGHPRSGTTWVGRTIAFYSGVRYIHEPFGAGYSELLIRKSAFMYPFKHISDGNEDQHADLYRYLSDTLGLTYHFRKELSAIQGLLDGLRLLRRLVRLVKVRCSHARPLIKDPASLFAAEWLAQSFGMRVIVLIRHPAAVVSSWKRGVRVIAFRRFAEQRELLEGMLRPFAKEILDYTKRERDIIDQGILLWNCLYHTILAYKRHHPEWLFARHEDLSRNPVEGFRDIFSFLSLPFRKSIVQEIVRHTQPGNPVEPENPRDLKRDSRANIWNWKKRLTPDEIRRIRKGTEEIASHFYSDSDW